MILTLIGTGAPLTELQTVLTQVLQELAIDDIAVQTTNDAAYKMELGITENPALAIEEESIDFRDVLFQGEIPEYKELLSLCISLFGDEDSEMCGCSSGGCGTGCCSSESCGVDTENTHAHEHDSCGNCSGSCGM